MKETIIQATQWYDTLEINTKRTLVFNYLHRTDQFATEKEIVFMWRLFHNSKL